jgi:peptide chain release factor 1
MFERLDLIESRYKDIEKRLASGTLDVKTMTGLMKELSDMSETVSTYRRYKSAKDELDGLLAMLETETDQDVIALAEAERDALKETIDVLTGKLEVLLLPKDPDDGKNVVMEIKGAAGGDEANLFAGDLFRMYQRYAEAKGWKTEVMNAMEGAAGGFSSIEFLVSGDRVHSILKHESGVHRVQRVPETESQGRIHTSTATVLVMPEAEEVEVDVNWDDIRFDTFNSSGPGGQSVNTTKSAVRLTHIPSGIAVACQEGKSQHDNRDKAFRLLKTRIYDKINEERLEAEGKTRRSLIGSGDRSEKIRTYNYPQNRVTDHRVSLTIQRLDAIMEGKLDLILEPLINEVQRRALEASGS